MRREIIGDCTLYLGDCLEVLPTLEAGSVDAIVMDPPYGIALENHAIHARMDGSTRKRVRDWSIRNDDSQEIALVLATWADSLKKPLAMFGSPYRPYPGKWTNILAWDKGPAVGGGGDPKTCWKRTFELIFIRNNTRLRQGRDAAVLKFHVSPNYRGDFDHHPAQKPAALMGYLIEQMTDVGATILDPFAGSGTTAVACIQTGRKFIGCEIDPGYFEIACRRIQDEYDRYPLFEKYIQRPLFPAI